MNIIYDWFGTRPCSASASATANAAQREPDDDKPSESPRLFNQEEEFNENIIISKINFISGVILKNNDFELYDFLKSIDISLHPFGM
jgi:hypothetical protein